MEEMWKMKNIYLVSYSVKGIKTLDELITLSFYKKTITRDLDTQEYNVKGIYGMNGSGKSAIVTSADILRNILTNSNYLNNPIVQKNLEETINKRLGELFIAVDYIINSNKMEDDIPVLMRYTVRISRNSNGKYVISHEKLSCKNACKKSDVMFTAYEVNKGEIISVIDKSENPILKRFLDKTVNLLEDNSMSTLFFDKILMDKGNNDAVKDYPILFFHLISLWVFGKSIHVYLDQSDDHSNYILNNTVDDWSNAKASKEKDDLLDHFVALKSDYLSVLSVTNNYVGKENYQKFSRTVEKLAQFLRIFKSDLIRIEIDKKENHSLYICNLVMVYESYKINAEFESTGVKKLIKLFAYLREMVHGGIVFLDEFDSNLHDVYLCALLEYLMEYGEGQLCFTTHNVGPMDVLKRHKKSIDFLSADHKIYPWTSNGNYSPSRLYRNGMIEGSPFNVDSVDFIGVFSSGTEDK